MKTKQLSIRRVSPLKVLRLACIAVMQIECLENVLLWEYQHNNTPALNRAAINLRQAKRRVDYAM